MNTMIKITICPTCGSNKIKKVRRNWTDEFQGQTYTVPNLEFYECPDCGEEVYDPHAMRKIEAYSPAYAKTRRRKQARAA
jgi:YgiT-type zinc finger domain-containing protein